LQIPAFFFFFGKALIFAEKMFFMAKKCVFLKVFFTKCIFFT